MGSKVFKMNQYIDGESPEYLVIYLLVDDRGFNQRISPFLMPLGTVFQHELGTYRVDSIDKKDGKIIAVCEKEAMDKRLFEKWA
jgi:hypothetical protein